MARIRTLLVANRGEIACRVLRTARSMGIATVAVFSDADADAPHVQQADSAVRLPGVAAADTYLRGDLLVAAAERTGADAVHPGYGFLSENADFARLVTDAGLVFVGPSSEAIEAMGSKIRARTLMESAGVPVLPGAVLTGRTDPAAAAAEIGYPLLVKASAGGGGRGMRIVHASDELAEAVRSARREAGAAFGDDTLFCERYLADPRHIEVQIFGDQAGDVIHLFERECSIQRRFQKVVEEAPSPAVSPELRERLGSAATAAGRALGYVGAGTVEFVLDADGGFFFLEVNTRLQVEHPVTELITGLDLVRLQLHLAEGHPLPAEARAARVHGHAVEVRLYAEDPVRGFLPTTGRLRDFTFPDSVRTDAGVAAGQTVGVRYDALLAKVIAHAPTRAEAVAVLAAALRASRVHGVTTNRDLLVGVLEHPEFLAGRTDTGFLTRHPAERLTRRPTDLLDDAAVAAVCGLRADRRRTVRVQPAVTPGWRNVRSADPVTRLRRDDGETLDVSHADLGGGDVRAGPGDNPPYVVTLERDGLRRTYHVGVTDHHLDVASSAGSVSFEVLDPLPEPGHTTSAGSLTAPLPGVVLRTEIEPGQVVRLGDALLVVEAMKMEHTVRAPADGVVTALLVAPGEQITAGQQLAVLEAADQ